MGEPKGKLVTPVAYNPDDELRTFEVDPNDYLYTNDQSDKLTSSELNLDAAKDLQVDVKTAPTTVVIPHADEKLFGIESVLMEVVEAESTTTTHELSSGAVPTGKIWVITHLQMINIDGDIATEWRLGVLRNSDYYYVNRRVEATAQRYTRSFTGILVLQAGDKVDAFFSGIGSGETLRMTFFGYVMNAP